MWNTMRAPRHSRQVKGLFTIGLLVVLVGLTTPAMADHGGHSRIGEDDEGTTFKITAEAHWDSLKPMGRHWSQIISGSGYPIDPYPGSGEVRACDGPGSGCGSILDTCLIPTVGTSPAMCTTRAPSNDPDAAAGECRYSYAVTTAGGTGVSIDDSTGKNC